MSDAIQLVHARIARCVRWHALGWLVTANLIGLWLAALLLWPTWGDALAPFSYGRWMPLHLNGQLYGWCALPLVGLLLRWMLVADHPAAAFHAELALGAWSLALVIGGVSWLAGVTSGKLFLDWRGWARPTLPVAMSVLWTLLGAHVWWGWRRDRLGQRWAKFAVLLVLAFVPVLFWWATGREVYPAVNPDSGGATGASLLGSTLLIVAIYGALPHLLRVPRCRPDGDKNAGSSRPECNQYGDISALGGRGFWGAFLASVVVWGLLRHGDASHHEWPQILGLGILLGWGPLLVLWWRRFAWCEGARPWLRAGAGWWLVLVVSGWLMFLPGLSERLKFTNALVAHAHLAMAGVVTSVNGAILNQLDPARRFGAGLGGWQAALAVMVVTLAVLGWFERDRATDFFANAAWVRAGYGVRLGAGLVMTLASARWLGETRR